MVHRPVRRGAAVALSLVLLATACGEDDGATVRDLGGESSGSSDADGSSSASASGSGSASASASAPSGSSSGSATAGDGSGAAVDEEGGYTYASDVTAHRQVTLDVCDVKEILDTDPIDFAAARAVYEDGEHSVNDDGSVRTLAGFATADDRLHGLDTYHDTPTPLDDWVSEALDGTGRFAGAAEAERSQAVEKGVQNQILVAWTIHELESALEKAEAGELDPDEGAPHNWDEAWAFYHGAAPACAPYATADSRAANFGTTGDDGTTALANEAIVTAMNAGRDALLAGDVDAARAAAEEVVRNLVITYSQAAIRYATLVPADVEAGDLEAAAEHRIEGLAFFRVIEAIVADAGADVDTIGAVFDLEADPGTGGGGDDVTAALEPAWATLGIDADDIGTLE